MIFVNYKISTLDKMTFLISCGNKMLSRVQNIVACIPVRNTYERAEQTFGNWKKSNPTKEERRRRQLLTPELSSYLTRTNTLLKQ